MGYPLNQYIDNDKKQRQHGKKCCKVYTEKQEKGPGIAPVGMPLFFQLVKHLFFPPFQQRKGQIDGENKDKQDDRRAD